MGNLMGILSANSSPFLLPIFPLSFSSGKVGKGGGEKQTGTGDGKGKREKHRLITSSLALDWVRLNENYDIAIVPWPSYAFGSPSWEVRIAHRSHIAGAGSFFLTWSARVGRLSMSREWQRLVCKSPVAVLDAEEFLQARLTQGAQHG